MRSALVMVTFGRHDLTKQTLDTLFKSDFEGSVTVIDNGSKGDVASLLLQFRDKINNLVFLNTNTGKPYAWNLGAEIARRNADPDFLCFCDSDLKFSSEWYDHLVSAYNEHRNNFNLCALAAVPRPPHGAELVEGDVTVNKRRWPTGCCLIVEPQHFDLIGHFDEERVIGAVDTDWFRQGWRKGFEHACIWPPEEARVTHTGKEQRTWQRPNKPFYRQ